MSRSTSLPTLQSFDETKFQPPIVNPACFLMRDHLFKKLDGSSLKRKKAVFIQAQAGQGKTVFAAQLLNHLQNPFVWYQITKEDADPIFFLHALYSGIQKRVPEAQSQAFEQMLSLGGVSEDNLDYAVQTLIKIIEEAIAGESLYLVIDDLHVLENSVSANRVLQLFLANSQHIKFIIISRHDSTFLQTDGYLAQTSLTVGGDFLKFVKTDIAKLFSGYLHIPISKSEVNQLSDTSQGWLAALLLLGERMRHRGENSFQRLEQGKTILDINGIQHFFETEILPTLAPKLVQLFFLLALLDEIPVALAQQITNDENIEDSLDSLIQKNLFTRKLNNQSNTYILHALFREALLNKGQKTLSSDTIHRVYQSAGAYYLKRGFPIQAIRYFLLAEKYDAAGEILSSVGLGLLAVNQTATLAQLIGQLSPEIVQQSPWLCLFKGVLSLHKDPNDAYRNYLTAKDKFFSDGNIQGEMFALAQLIHFHIYVDGRHQWGRPHLHRLEELYIAKFLELDPVSQMRFAHAIAGGCCFFDFNAEKIDKYSRQSLATASHLDLPNYIATARVVNCYRYSFVGDWSRFQKEMESSLSLLASPQVSMEHKLGLIIAQISVLIMQGDFTNYQQKKEWLRSYVGKNIMSLSVIEPFLTIYDTNLLIAQKRYPEALKVINEGLQRSGPGHTSHQTSQMLHFLALLEALSGNETAALDAAEKSRRLRLEVGPGRFDGLNQIVLGISNLLLGYTNEAEALFNSAHATLTEMEENHLIVSVCLNRAFLYFRKEDWEQAKIDLRFALTQMKRHDYVYFFGWVPSIVQTMLQVAVDWDIEADYAKKLAKHRLGLVLQPSESSLPILKIKVCGALALTLNEKIALETDLSPIQRQCLALLLCSEGHCLAQERLQDILWPESSQEKSRSNFDTMLSRLRKTLTSLFDPYPVKAYLSLQRGLLRLKNVKTDIETFKFHAYTALESAKKESFWQAEMSSSLAMNVWAGKPFANLSANDLIDSMRFEHETLYLKSAHLWAQILVKNKMLEEAINVVQQALLLNPTEHQLVQCLYQISVRAGRPAHAAKAIQNYRANLEREEYLPEEIGEILDSLWEEAS